jgi:SAM-dependent methyltransferase
LKSSSRESIGVRNAAPDHVRKSLWKGFHMRQTEESGDHRTARLCPLCESSRQIGQEQYSPPPWRVVQCARCGFVYLANPVDYADLVEDQAWEKNHRKELERRRQDHPALDRSSKGTRWRLRLTGNTKPRIFSKVFRQGRVLDVGCGEGKGLPEPLVPFGVEISKQLAAKADQRMRERGGHCIHAPALEGIGAFDAGFFDGVLLRSFLEHENNPLPLLKEVFRVLSDDGVVYIRVPNYSSVNRRVMGGKWCGFRHPDHVNYFTAKTLRKISGLAGFRMQILNRLNLSFDDNIKVILKKACEPAPA